MNAYNQIDSGGFYRWSEQWLVSILNWWRWVNSKAVAWSADAMLSSHVFRPRAKTTTRRLTPIVVRIAAHASLRRHWLKCGFTCVHDRRRQRQLGNVFASLQGYGSDLKGCFHPQIYMASSGVNSQLKRIASKRSIGRSVANLWFSNGGNV